MYKHLPVSAASKMGSVLIIMLSSALAACSSGELALDDTYVPATHYENFPIEVSRRPVRMEIASGRGSLQSAQINAISGFSRQAMNSGSSRITILRPAGGGASGTVARQTYQLLVQSGIPARMITQKTYPGSAKEPVKLSYVRSVAVTKECGDWSSDMANAPDNGPYSNAGCSVQSNIAAMVVNPDDFVVPRPTTPALASTRTLGVAATMAAPAAASSASTSSTTTTP